MSTATWFWLVVAAMVVAFWVVSLGWLARSLWRKFRKGRRS